MCIFTRSVTLVANTRIFARSCTSGHQILVYSMTMDADAELAMILPLPITSRPRGELCWTGTGFKPSGPPARSCGEPRFRRI